MKTLTKISSIFSWLVVLVVLLTSGLLFLSVFDTPIKIRVFSVLSGSMEPAISTGSLVVVIPQSDYQVGDIVTAHDPRGQETITHRVVSVSADLGETRLTLKGDANETPDSDAVLQSRVVGKVQFSLPYLGRVVKFTQTQQGFLFLIIIPAVILVYSEILNIKNEAKRLLKERTNRRLNFVEKMEVELGAEMEKVEDQFKK